MKGLQIVLVIAGVGMGACAAGLLVLLALDIIDYCKGRK